MANAYSADYLAKWDVIDEQDTDRTKAMQRARELRTQGYTIKVTKVSFSGFGYGDTWTIEGKRPKLG